MKKAYTYIRFSTPEQASGHSQTRQKELIDRYIEVNNLERASDGDFADLGISSFRGDNLSHGLGEFMVKVRDGSIERGSVLIVESTDRLSRQPPIDAIALLIEIVKSGISLVTLSDSGIREYNNDAGMIELILFLGHAHRAHEESKIKSDRLKAVWESKRKNVYNKIVTSHCPLWLKVKPDKSGFEPITERANTVKLIYELAAEGWGYGRIAKKLNAEKYSSFSEKGKGWYISTVRKILSSRAVIGSYQPHKLISADSGKRVRTPAGEEIENYYPRTVDDDLYNRVTFRNKINPSGLVGRQGNELTNLFSGLLQCGFCNSSMTLVSKGAKKNTGRYLVCSAASRGKGCLYRAWRYNHLEDIVLAHVRNIDYRIVLKGDEALKEEIGLETEEISVLSELDKNEKTLLKLTKSVDAFDGLIPNTFIEMINNAELNILALTKRNKEIAEGKRLLAEKKSNSKEFVKNLLEVLTEIDNSSSERKYGLRVKIRSEIAKSVKSISLYSRTRTELKLEKPPNRRSLKIYFRYGGSRTVLMINDEKAHVIDLEEDTSDVA